MLNKNFTELTRHFSRHEELPSQFEQDLAEAYCHRELVRPDINIFQVSKYFVLSELIIVLFTIVIFFFFNLFDVNSLIQFSFNKYPLILIFVIFLLINLILFILFFRRILICCIRLYQHYASEDIRRRCLFKPTCSEYTILVLRKYGVLIGLYLAYIRLYKK